MFKFRIVLKLTPLALAILILGCNNQAEKKYNYIPLELQPNWDEIDIDKLPVKFGQRLRFENDSIIINVVVLDFNKDESGIWIGLCFIDSNRLFGRQIPNGLINTNCIDLMDLSYINSETLKEYKIVDNLIIDKNKVGIGSIEVASNINELKRTYDLGIEQRKKEQTPCNKGLTDLNPIRECYFEIDKIKK